jgi:hypothetical protein
MVLAVPGKPLEAGLLESGLACLADRRAAALVFVVGGHIADPGVEPHAVVALADQRELGAQHRRVADLVEVGPFGLDVAEQRVGCQKLIVAVTSSSRLTRDYDAPSLARFPWRRFVWSGRSSTWRCAAALS